LTHIGPTFDVTNDDVSVLEDPALRSSTPAAATDAKLVHDAAQSQETMPANYVILEWAEQSARALGHRLGKWDQRGQIATSVCVRCGLTAVADFSKDAAERDAEVSGDAVVERCGR
jgi:hypothetical protein